MDDRGGKLAFDIGDIPKNFDLNLPPSTGFDYLYRVRLETRKCPKVVVSTIDTSQFLDRQTVQVDVFNGFVRARPGFEPDSGWQREQLDRFCDLRTKLSQDKDELKEKVPRKINFPKITKSEEWCRFCLGTEAHSKIHPPQEASDSDAPSKSKKSKILPPEGNPPLVSTMVHMTQKLVTRLLSYHIAWLEKIGFSHAQGKWLYALLMCLEKPLDPDTCADLRSLSRLCSKLRDELPSPDSKFVDSINLILCIVAQYFDQKDMSDHFADNP